MHSLTRRMFLATAPLASFGSPRPAAQAPDSNFPSQPLALVKEMVSVAHGNVARVKELVRERPALARAAWDWGYGDWETALGAASHVGNREIAEVLIANGAHVTIFSAAMLGQLDVVKAFVTAGPGIQRTRGPHGISLLSHAKAGGPQATAVVAYLESVGDADPRYTNETLDEAGIKEIAGSYSFGSGSADRMVVAVNSRGALVVTKEGAIERMLFHRGGRVFNPSGAEAVRIRFEPLSGRATTLTIQDGSSMITATRP